MSFKIKVTLLRSDGHWYSYGIALGLPYEGVAPFARTDVTFEAPGLDNDTIEGDYEDAADIPHNKIANAAERLVREFEDAPDPEVGDAGTGHGAYEFRSGN